MTTVLLVDDERDMASLVAMCLEDFDVRVLAARDLGEALSAARLEPPSVVLLDLVLEGEDGLAILPFLRAEPALSHVPIVGFSVHESRRREALDRGLSAFVPKPFRAENLRAAVRPYLEER